MSQPFRSPFGRHPTAFEVIDGSICRVSGRGVRARRRLIGRQNREIAATQITLICMVAGLSDLERKTVQAVTRAPATGWLTALCDQRLSKTGTSLLLAEPGSLALAGRAQARR